MKYTKEQKQKALKKLTRLYGEWNIITDNDKETRRDRQWKMHKAPCGKLSHKMRGVCIEAMEKAPCEHEPKSAFYNEAVAFAGECKHCGVKLKANWNEVKP